MSFSDLLKNDLPENFDVKRLVTNNQASSDSQNLSCSKQLNNSIPCNSNSNLNETITFTDFMNLPISDAKQSETYEKMSDKLNVFYPENHLKRVNVSSDYSDKSESKKAFNEIYFENRTILDLDTADEGSKSYNSLQNYSKSATRPALNVPKSPDNFIGCNKKHVSTFPETPSSSPLITETAIVKRDRNFVNRDNFSIFDRNDTNRSVDLVFTENIEKVIKLLLKSQDVEFKREKSQEGKLQLKVRISVTEEDVSTNIFYEKVYGHLLVKKNKNGEIS